MATSGRFAGPPPGGRSGTPPGALFQAVPAVTVPLRKLQGAAVTVRGRSQFWPDTCSDHDHTDRIPCLPGESAPDPSHGARC